MTEQVPSKERDTPRTDAVVSDGWSGDAACVSYADCQAIERDLTAEIERLQRENVRLTAICEYGHQWETDGARSERAGHEPGSALDLAKRFHEVYERLAPSFGYETRTETRVFDPESKNGRLMVAVCAELAAAQPPGNAVGEILLGWGSGPPPPAEQA